MKKKEVNQQSEYANFLSKDSAVKARNASSLMISLRSNIKSISTLIKDINSKKKISVI